MDDLTVLFPEGDYRFHMGLERGAPEEFFAPTTDHDSLIAERRRWLAAEPAACCACLPQCEALLDETLETLSAWGSLSKEQTESFGAIPSVGGRCAALGAILEPDFLLMQAGETGEFELSGGCVCFPSSWSLAEKIGRPMSFIHGVVPRLNAQIGGSIHAFLQRLAPAVAWRRHNWGLTRSAELHQHPRRNLPRLDASVGLGDVWLRVERQVLVALPRTRGVLFGIRIALHSLADIRSQRRVASGLIRALQTMPDEVARYKGIDAARSRILQLLIGEERQ